MTDRDAEASLISRIRVAAQTSHIGYSICLTKLLDGVSTYTATCCDQTQEFEDRDDAYDWVEKVRSDATAALLKAALADYAKYVRELDGQSLQLREVGGV